MRCVIGVLFLTLLLAACSSQDQWQQRGALQPISYRPKDAESSMTIGSLRRLALLPSRFEYMEDGKIHDDASISLSLSLDAVSADLLKQLGYEIIQTRDEENPERRERFARCSELASEWAKRARGGAALPAELKSCTGEVGRSFGADGVMIVQGWGEPTTTAMFGAVVVTASLAWPLLFAQTKVTGQADIVETAGSRHVWRSTWRSKNPDEARNIRLIVFHLFEELEHATPKASTSPPTE